ncbi:Holliday junction branch migration protein RuvA [Candidatus Uhrbacteria bacterium]|nr:Holliday junction branch migration protein RuvA [Candidatus Uhrbacteria bacterium]
MLAFLRGTIRSILPDSVVVELHDVGYRVFLPPPLRERLRVGERVELYTHEVVREDRRELFGMGSADELSLFHDLLTVSGVGPKIALGLLGLGTPAEIRHAIAREDAVYLSKVIGIGRKTAERVVVELKGKMAAYAEASAAKHGGEDDVLDALVQLGYKIQEVRDVIRKLPVSAATTEQKLKVALQALGKR